LLNATPGGLLYFLGYRTFKHQKYCHYKCQVHLQALVKPLQVIPRTHWSTSDRPSCEHGYARPRPHCVSY
jgi:hypothetical protein